MELNGRMVLGPAPRSGPSCVAFASSLSDSMALSAGVNSHADHEHFVDWRVALRCECVSQWCVRAYECVCVSCDRLMICGHHKNDGWLEQLTQHGQTDR